MFGRNVTRLARIVLRNENIIRKRGMMLKRDNFFMINRRNYSKHTDTQNQYSDTTRTDNNNARNSIRDNVKSSMQDSKENIKRNMNDSSQNLKENVKDSYENIKDNSKNSYENIKENAKNSYENIKENAQDSYENMKENAKDTYDNTKSHVKKNYQNLESKNENMKEKFQDTTNKAKEKAKETYNESKNKYNETKEKMEDNYDKFKNESSDKYQNVKNNIKQSAQNMKQKIEDTAEDVEEDVKEKFQKGKQKLKENIDDMEDKAKNKYEKGKQKFKENMDDMEDEAKDKYEKTKQKFNEQTKEMKDKTTKIMKDVETKFKNIAMFDLLKQSRQSLETFIRDKSISKEMFQNAKAIIILHSKKGGLGVSGVKGHGIMIQRINNDEWSLPCAVSLSGVSIGLNAGYETIDSIVVINDESSVKELINKHQLIVGGDVSYAMGNSGHERSYNLKDFKKTTSFSMTKGAYISFSLEGESIKIDHNYNKQYYNTEQCDINDIMNAKVIEPTDNHEYNMLIQIINNYINNNKK